MGRPNCRRSARTRWRAPARAREAAAPRRRAGRRRAPAARRRTRSRRRRPGGRPAAARPGSTEQVLEARRPILSSGFPDQYPGASLGTTNARCRGRRAAAVGAGHREHQVRRRAVGDPRLGAVQHPAGALAGGLRPQARRVRTRVRLGEREGAEQLAARHRLEPPLLLLRRRGRGASAWGAAPHRDRDARVAGRDLLQREEVRQGVEAEPVVRLGDQHPEEAQLPQPPQDPAVERRARGPTPPRGAEVPVGEGARQVADLVLFDTEQTGHCVLRTTARLRVCALLRTAPAYFS